MLIGQQHRRAARAGAGLRGGSRIDFLDARISEGAHELPQEGVSLAGRGRRRVRGHFFEMASD